jgi:tripeptide aminopeptidase
MIDEKTSILQFLELTSIHGISLQERQIIDYLKNHIKKLGFDCYEDNTSAHIKGEAGNLICKVVNSKNRGDDESFLMAAHVDTITPSCENPQVINGRIVSSSDRILGADDRVGVMVLLQILEMIAHKKIDFPNLEIIFLVAEEIGLKGSKNLDYDQISASYGFNFDCSAKVGQVVVAATAKLNFELSVIGHESHSAVAPEKGISAISMASEIISKINLPSKKDETIFNVGKICGGKKNNIIPGEVLLNGEIRSFEKDTINAYLNRIETVSRKVSADYGGKFNLTHILDYNSFILDESSKPLKIIRKAAKQAGISYEAIRYLAGSDANIFNENGIPSINIGLGYVNNHSSDEYIEIEDLLNAIELGIKITQIAASK